MALLEAFSFSAFTSDGDTRERSRLGMCIQPPPFPVLEARYLWRAAAHGKISSSHGRAVMGHGSQAHAGAWGAHNSFGISSTVRSTSKPSTSQRRNRHRPDGIISQDKPKMRQKANINSAVNNMLRKHYTQKSRPASEKLGGKKSTSVSLFLWLPKQGAQQDCTGLPACLHIPREAKHAHPHVQRFALVV